MAILFTNNASTTLSASITNSATSLTVSSGTGSLFPNPTSPDYFLVTLQGVSGTPIEIVKVTARSTDTFTIVRAQDSTTASAFSTGDKFELRLTAGEINNLFSGIVQGGGQDHAFIENDTTVTADYTVTTGRNAFQVGPVTVSGGVTVTIPSGSRLLVL